MSKVINTLTSILAGAELGCGTKGDFGLAEFSRESARTVALIGTNFVNTCRIVLTSVTNAVVGVDLATNPFETMGTNAPKME